jgi:hypothetical protein
MSRPLTPFACALAALTLTPAALATQPSEAPAPLSSPPLPQRGDDVLHLQDGTLLRGQIAERRPDGTVVIVLLTREVRTVPGEQIASVSHPTPPAPPAPLVPPPAPAAEEEDSLATLSPGEGRVPVVFRSEGAPVEVGLFLGTSETVEWTRRVRIRYHSTLCITPCTLYARPGRFPLWTGGEGLVSDDRTLMVPQGGLRVRLHGSSYNGRQGGTILALLGGIATGVGFGMAVVSGSSHSYSRDGGDGLLVGGGLVIGLGLTALVSGIVLLVQNPGGVASISPLERTAAGRTPPWNLGIAPLSEGGTMLGAALQF